MKQLSKNFSEEEFSCRCGCGSVYVDQELVEKLQELRDLLDTPITINSACRCQDHNKKVGGVKNSYHLSTPGKLCEAADIACSSASERYRIVGLAGAVGFSGIGVGTTFVHLDIRKTTPALWIYPYSTTKACERTV